MKILISIILLLTIGLSKSFAEEEIPHYKIYPRTPIVDYKNEVLDFYSVKDSYGEFSNFALFPITIEGIIWPSSEHYYQAHKFLDHDLQERVRVAASPFLAAQIGRDSKLPIRDDWDDVKDGFMLVALHAKYSQYSVLKDLLLSTQNSHIYEHTKNDCYWADCGDHTGKNMLGQQLMQIREEIKVATKGEILLND
ncbi:MAG: NADAR family protein [Bacteriovorax sp.]|nr:NADAR family protein [Bacteriovorax sp.]